MYSAKILADSLSPDGARLVTFECVFPRFILAEVNTHRALSRNSASSRAIPTEKLIERVKLDPFVPEFNARVKGMGVGEPLPEPQASIARQNWLIACRNALKSAESLQHIDKSRVNRLLEPFMWHTALITATEWGNFFALRTAPEAQPEFRKIALMMQKCMEQHEPAKLSHGQWHLPLIRFDESRDAANNPTYWKKVSTGRCARISYLTHDGHRDPEEDIKLHDRLLESRHLSPFEHVATPLGWRDVSPDCGEELCAQAWSGNFRGFKQYRSEIPNEHDYSLVTSCN